VGSGRSELILGRKGEEKSQTTVGCRHRVGNSLDSVPKITEVGLAKGKGKETKEIDENCNT